LPLTCKLEAEDGEVLGEVNDADDVFHGLLPKLDDETFHCLRFVDWYGDTVFNRIQAERVLFEVGLLQRRATSGAERQLLERIEDLARRCRDDVHHCLKFYGD
jgi:hypothetical protein